jgi:hypothetical protein
MKGGNPSSASSGAALGVQEFAVALARWCRNYWYVGGSAIALMVFGLAAVFVGVGTTRDEKGS